jgi:pyruvate, orthophosphate dikinase
MKKWIYFFGQGQTEGSKDQKDLLGGKGANLAEMTSIGLPVPPGFTISTEACLDFYKTNRKISEEIWNQSLDALKKVEEFTSKKFGDEDNPLLFSVRSGARVSMPGMMDTVLNLGLNDKSVLGLAKLTNNPRFAWDSYRRFIQMYADVVMDVNTSIFEVMIEDLKEIKGITLDTELTAQDLQDLVKSFKKSMLEEHGLSFPQDPMKQLENAIAAVFNSWNNSRAIKYRQINGFSHDWGTAVNVQSMVFGNMGENCGTGVAFTRNPSTGENVYFGEYLMNAQGEDVVAGIRTPAPINENSFNESNKNEKTLKQIMPKVYLELEQTFDKLENHYKEMQDIEFTIEREKLYLLQTRNGKRTAQAGVKIAVDMVNEKMIDEKMAVMRINPEDLNQLLHPTLDPKKEKKVLARGLPASPGAASGTIVFDSETAQVKANAGDRVILVRIETSPEDIGGMASAKGVLTARGGMTSHAAVVARGMGKCCVAGCAVLNIDYAQKKMTIQGKDYFEGDELTLDGATGEVIQGIVPTIAANINDDFLKYMNYVDNFRRLKVRANADNPEDAKIARSFGAQGIGLCRTEHMFFAAERISKVREMIFAQNTNDRIKAIDSLMPFQKEDFLGLFKEMNGLPVNIRLLDPPLHEFLPHKEEEFKEIAGSLNMELKEVKGINNSLHEFNPMLGHRGCRLGISYPEIYIMQTRAIIEAAIESKREGLEVYPEIMIPLIGHVMELKILKERLKETADEILLREDYKLEYKVGTMIELPRAAITAGEIAKEADFFSFGTNDLTQTTLGLSRDDSGKFLPLYVQKGIYQVDPFVSIDESGVGFLVEHATKEGIAVNKDLHCGICGEHGGDPKSITFCHNIGLEYVSCSPFRVPIARLAAAQAAINSN